MRHNSPTPPNPSDMRNLIIAVVLCTGLLFVWQVLYVNPRETARREALRQQAEITQQAVRDVQEGDVILPTPTGTATAADDISGLSRDAVLQQTPRVKISSRAVHGSVNLQGLRFDDLTLARHRVSLEEDSPEVVLLTPAENVNRYFLQVGWLPASQKSGVQLPDSNSLWQADSDMLTPENPVTFTWSNPQGIAFSVKISLDEDYLFTVEQEINNPTSSPITVMPYGLANRAVPKGDRFGTIIHTGPMGVFNGTLSETSYGNLEDEGKERFADTQGWFGIADKYWLTAFVPPKGEDYNVNFQHVSPRGHDRAQVDYLAPAQTIPAGGREQYNLHIFAGAKELNVLEKYREGLDLPLFDRALDFGVLYFLTKPIFLALDYFYGLIGNFGLAIMLFVVLLKIALFPLSNKSYRSMAQMRALQPEIESLRKRHEGDKMKMQQEVMALWQRERVNPVSGCLPMLIQIPIFFALYKVLLVTIEMRHAPFYGWIHDLSASDPTNIFTLFGLIPWDPPSVLHIGLWPIIMCLTMVLQQKLNPKPTDPIQAKVIGFLPYIFLILFARFPAGLLIYWAWNNTLSILQQAYITRSFERHQKRKEKKRLKLAEEQG